MRPARGLLVVTALLAACGSSSDGDAPASAPAAASSDTSSSSFSLASHSYIELRDSTQWSYSGVGGTRATLVLRGEVVDMVETNSVQPLTGGAVIYQQVQTNDVDDEQCGGPCYDLAHWTLFDGTHRPLEQMLPLFSGLFSSPAVAGDVIYYWGLDRIAGTDSLRITANRFSFADSSHTSLFLFNDALATDNPGYFERPQLVGDDVVFRTFDRTIVADRQLGAVR